MFVLSKQLLGHNNDVRCVCAISDTLIATGSNDNTIKIWDVQSGELIQTLTKHTNFVTALATMTVPSSSLPGASSSAEGLRKLLLSASYDGTVKVWDAESLSDEPLLDLHEHKDKITSLWVDESRGIFVTGSWDNTVHIWHNFTTAQVLEGHTGAVFAVTVEPQTGNFVSASDDKTVRIWSPSGGLLKVCSGAHSARVRGLAPFGPGFISCSNDLTIVCWDAAGNSLSTLASHRSYVYGVAVPPSAAASAASSADFYSCGEDRTVRVWKGGEVVQGLVHPTSVWACAALGGGGDLVTCCGDGVVRVWTRDPARAMAPEDAATYAASLVSEIPSGAAGLVAGETALVPPVEQMSAEPGAYDGDTRPFREGPDVSIFRWDARTYAWVRTWKVNFGRQVYQGKEYDIVFDVELDNKYYKLPFNVAENEYIAADRFLDANGLGRCYLEDVAYRLRSYRASVMGGGGAGDGASQEAMAPPPPQKQCQQQPVTRRSVTQTDYSLYVITDFGKVLSKLDPAVFTEAEKETIGKALTAEKVGVTPAILGKLFACPPAGFLPVGGVLSMLVMHKKMSPLFTKYRDASKNDVFDVTLRAAEANPAEQIIPFRVLANALSMPVLAQTIEGHMDVIVKVSEKAGLTTAKDLVKSSVLSVFLK